MKHKKLLIIPAALLLAVSFVAEYFFCFEAWITDAVMSYVFIFLCVAVQALCAELICLSCFSVKHRWVVMLSFSLGLAFIFSVMLHIDYIINADSNVEMMLSAAMFNLTPLIAGAVVFVIQALFNGISGKIRGGRKAA